MTPPPFISLWKLTYIRWYNLSHSSKFMISTFRPSTRRIKIHEPFWDLKISFGCLLQRCGCNYLLSQSLKFRCWTLHKLLWDILCAIWRSKNRSRALGISAFNYATKFLLKWWFQFAHSSKIKISNFRIHDYPFRSPILNIDLGIGAITFRFTAQFTSWILGVASHYQSLKSWSYFMEPTYSCIVYNLQ